jgi:hypothetical protein
MDEMTMTVALAILGIAVIALLAWTYRQRQRRRALRARFGPEYDRMVRDAGSPAKAEAELKDRAKRVEQFHIRDLSHPDRERFSDAWRRVQALFVDDPPRALTEGDRLITEVMRSRGYPVDDDFERRANDLSVNHPLVVQHYRAGRLLAVERERGSAGTEELRQAMVHYRALFEELVTGGRPHHERRAS